MTRLDSIVTMVDCENFSLDLFNSQAAESQIAYGDIIILNKTALVDEADVDLLEVRLRDMKKDARILRTKRSQVPLPLILSVGLFESDKYFDHTEESDHHHHDHEHEHDEHNGHSHGHTHSIFSFGHSHAPGEGHGDSAEKVVEVLKGGGMCRMLHIVCGLTCVLGTWVFDDPYLNLIAGDRGSRITVIGLVSNVGLTAAKGAAGWYMNSASLLADAGHSLSGEYRSSG